MDLMAAHELAYNLMHQHGLIYQGWQFKFDRATSRFGTCRYSRRFIQLSKPLTLVNDEVEVRDTILHEIAHALTPGADHGPVWKLQAQAIGARPERCFTTARVKLAATKYEGICMDCGHKVPRTRKPNVHRTYTHIPCNHKPNKGLIRWNDPSAPRDIQHKPELAQNDISAMWERLNRLEKKL